jgi:hypothetical protein
MSNILLKTEKINDLKEGDYLITPTIVKDKGDSKPYIMFSLIKFVKGSLIQDGTANEETSLEKVADNFGKDPTIAKVQYLGEVTLVQVSDAAEIKKLQKKADDLEATLKEQEGDHDSTYHWQSLTSGYFKTPGEALNALKEQIQEIYEAINTSIQELEDISHKEELLK